MLFSPFERMVALRYLRSRRREGFISVIAVFSLLGIMLGVATLIIVMSVMNGFRAELFSRIIGLNGHMAIYSQMGQLANFDEIATRVRHLPNVSFAVPTLDQQALITGRGSPRGVMVRAMRPEDFLQKPILSTSIIAGSASEFGEHNIAIGRRLSSDLGAYVGDTITLISPQGRNMAFGSSPRFATFRVAAIFDVDMYEFDAGYIYMPLDTAQTFYQSPLTVSYIEVITKDVNNLEPVKAAIADGNANVRVLDWKDRNGAFLNVVQVERNVMFLILSLMTAIASFNIICSLYMLVQIKGRDIAILRTMGATRGMIMRIFVLTGASLGIVGTILGTLIGVAFAENIESIRQLAQKMTEAKLFDAEFYFFSQLPAQIHYTDVIQVVGIALFFSLTATILPARRAARLDPVEALRYE